MENGFIQKQTMSGSYNDDVNHDDDYKNNMVKDLCRIGQGRAYPIPVLGLGPSHNPESQAQTQATCNLHTLLYGLGMAMDRVGGELVFQTTRLAFALPHAQRNLRRVLWLSYQTHLWL